MEITEKNLGLVQAFTDILIGMNISNECILMLLSMLADIPQMNEMVMYIKTNLRATEAELIDKAAKISGLIET